MTFKLEVKKIGAIYKNTVRQTLSSFDPTRANGTIYHLSLQQQDIKASIYRNFFADEHKFRHLNACDGHFVVCLFTRMSQIHKDD